MAKHVIFLGAGASRSSGYPLANELRLLISSWSHLKDALIECAKNHKLSDMLLGDLARTFIKEHQRVIDVFRYGGYATVDEFCNLENRPELLDAVNVLRCLSRAILGLKNPEDTFENSDYYSFVAALFRDNFINLREDIVVLSYNYDPYLEFLLCRAIDFRFKVAKQVVHTDLHNAVTGGLWDIENREWLTDTTNANQGGFCLLKLHGSICFPTGWKDSISFHTLFGTPPDHRVQKLFDTRMDGFLPPLVFPWEVGGESEPITMNMHHGPLRISGLGALFRGVWERARLEVQRAKKISFVGLSMHRLLQPGLAKLFAGKKNQTEIGVANSANVQSAAATIKTLRKVAPEMSIVGRRDHALNLSDGDVTLSADFRSFINEQMLPLED